MIDSWQKYTPIAHRGLHSRTIPENSLMAFEEAIKFGYAIELDIHLLDSGEIVVFHDETANRVLGVEGNIKKMTLNQLKSHKLLESEQTVPTLLEVLDLVKGRVPLLIEIKERKFTYKSARALVKILDNYSGAFAVQSFNPYPLYWLRKKRPDWKIGILSGRLLRSDLTKFQKFALKYLLPSFFVKPDFFGLEYTNEDRVQELLAISFFNKPIIHWTITDINDADRIIENDRNIIFENFIPRK